jgi:hypothetical protein
MNDDDYEYIKLRSTFTSPEAYSRNVRRHLKKGMHVRCCESVECIDLFFGQTGTVVTIDSEIEFSVQVIFISSHNFF